MMATPVTLDPRREASREAADQGLVVRALATSEEVIECIVRAQPSGRRGLQGGEREVMRIDVDGVDAARVLAEVARDPAPGPRDPEHCAVLVDLEEALVDLAVLPQDIIDEEPREYVLEGEVSQLHRRRGDHDDITARPQRGKSLPRLRHRTAPARQRTGWRARCIVTRP